MFMSKAYCMGQFILPSGVPHVFGVFTCLGISRQQDRDCGAVDKLPKDR